MGDRGAPGLIFLRPATQISNRLVHHSRSANTSVVVTLVLFRICGQVTLTHTHTRTFPHKCAQHRVLPRHPQSHNLCLMNVYKQPQTHTRTHVPTHTHRHRTKSHTCSSSSPQKSEPELNNQLSFPCGRHKASCSPPTSPPPPSSILPPSLLPPGV